MTKDEADRLTVAAGGSEVPAVLLDRVDKVYAGNVRAVSGLSLAIQPGEVVAILGPNGAGKTTALDMILGLAQPSRGTVQVYGLTPRQAVDTGRIAAVTQTGGLLGDVSVGDHIRLFASLFGYDKAHASRVIEGAGLTDLAKRRIQACSGGEKQLVKFAMALVSNPDMIILDEPTTGMDVMVRQHFWERIHADAQAGRTVLFATHYLEEADEFADRIVIIVNGRTVADGTTAEIRAMASGRTVQADFESDEAASQAAVSLLEQDLVISATARGPRLVAQTNRSDDVIKDLFAMVPPARNVLVAAQGLEEAFVALSEGGL